MAIISKSKKMLVEYSMKNCAEAGFMQGIKRDFVVPVFDDGSPKFVTLPDLRSVEYGFVVFLGREISTADLFKRILDSEKKILPTMEWQENILNKFLNEVSMQKIGNVVKISFNNEDIVMEVQEIKRNNVSNTKIP